MQYLSPLIEANVGFRSREKILSAELLGLEFTRLTRIFQERKTSHAKAADSLRGTVYWGWGRRLHNSFQDGRA